MIRRWGVKGALQRIESKDSPAALYNMQTMIEAGRPDLLWEEIVLQNPSLFDADAVQAIYDFACNHFPRFGITPTNPFSKTLQGGRERLDTPRFVFPHALDRLQVQRRVRAPRRERIERN
jgi:hypothetical protein